MTILITRPQPDAERLAKHLQQKGYYTLIDPLIEIEFIDVELSLKGVQAILVTSLNGIRALAHVSPERAQLLYAVGPGSASEARSLGFENVRYASGNIQALIEKIQHEMSPLRGKMIYVCGDVIGGDIVGELKHQGFEAEKHMIYRTKEATTFTSQTLKAFKANKISLILFFSPRTVDIFVKLLQQSSLESVCESITALCLSTAVRERLKGLHWKSTQVPARLSQIALLKLIPNYTR
ncbi:MAG: uroporphyrinogen-III synthase [Alphaproteobacteria bacterium]|nr:uroporphyrinogen-III synthase [Alphaproteobacteria bacterium]